MSTWLGKALRAVRFVSLERVRDVLRSTFWLVPALLVAASFGLALGLVALDGHLSTANIGFLYPGPPDGARELLSSIVTAMIAFTGLVFSITILILQLTSGQFSPRVLRMFLRDRLIRVTLGVFVATFVYAIVVQREVGGTSGDAKGVPRIAVTMAFVLVLVSVAFFIAYISHVANMVRVVNIIAEIAAESRVILAERFPVDGRPEPPAGSLPPVARIVPTPHPGVLVSVDEGALTRLADAGGCVIVLTVRVGDFVPVDSPLFALHAEGRPVLDNLAKEVRGEVALDTERTMEQDLAFGFRQLVDIAERALSPAVNDPTTACQSIDALHDLLRRLATRHLFAGRYAGADGQLRLVVPQYSFADFLELAVSEIWRYGSDAAQVPGRFERMLADLAVVALPEHQAAVRRWADHIGLHPGFESSNRGSPANDR